MVFWSYASSEEITGLMTNDRSYSTNYERSFQFKKLLNGNLVICQFRGNKQTYDR